VPAPEDRLAAAIVFELLVPNAIAPEVFKASAPIAPFVPAPTEPEIDAPPEPLLTVNAFGVLLKLSMPPANETRLFVVFNVTPVPRKLEARVLLYA